MAPTTFEEAQYSSMLWDMPLSVHHAGALLMNFDLDATASIIDLDCGRGALLLAAAHMAPHAAILTGIDSDRTLIARAKAEASARDLANVTFIEMPAAEVRQTAERAICIGASRALGGTRGMLRRLAELVPRGKVLVGEKFWDTVPTPDALALAGEAPSLEQLVEMAKEEGWVVLHLSVADQGERDEFEWARRARRREWCLANPDDPRVEAMKRELDRREAGYLTVYRGMLGFAYLILAR